MEKKQQIVPFLVRIDDEEEQAVDPRVFDGKDFALEHVRGQRYLLRRAGRTIPLVIQVQDRQHLVIWAHNRAYRVHISDHRDQLLAIWGYDAAELNGLGDVIAPMPGLVLNVSVGPGDNVVAGQAIVVLEAMKMENELRADADGIVSEVRVAEGNAVAKGDVLVTFEAARS